MFAFLLCLALSLANISPAISATAGPVGKIRIENVGNCDTPINKLGVVWDFKTRDDDWKAADVSVDLKYDLDENTMIKFYADSWENGNWQSSQNVEGGMFDYINKYFGKIYTNFRNSVKPKIEAKDFIPAGKYELTSFAEKAENIELPQILYGRLKINATLTNGDNEDFLCVQVEMESMPPY